MEKTWAAHGLNGASFDVLTTFRHSGPHFALSQAQRQQLGDLLRTFLGGFEDN